MAAAAASFLATRNAKASLASAAWVAAWSLLFLTPWLSVHLPYYLSALAHPLGQPLTPVPEVAVSTSIDSLLSMDSTFYGPPRFIYTCVVAGLLVCAVFAVLQARREPGSRGSCFRLAAALIAAGASYFFWVLVGPYIEEETSTFRYSIPALVGVTSSAIPLWAMLAPRRVLKVWLVAAAVLVLLFASSARERLSRLLHEGTALAYLHSWSGASAPPGRTRAQRSGV